MKQVEIEIQYCGDVVYLNADLSDDAAPLQVDGKDIGLYTSDACGRVMNAVVLAARHAWPNREWPRIDGQGQLRDVACREDETTAWDELEYTNMDNFLYTERRASVG